MKSHGLGNDYLVMDPRTLSIRLTPAAVRLICHRNLGIGSDGVLTVERRRAGFGMRILNPDGSEAEKSGNGARIFAKFLWDHGYLHQRTFTIETKGGPVGARLLLSGRRVRAVAADMGRASFRSRDIPVAGGDREVVGERIVVDGSALEITAVTVGNPHCVVFVDDPATVNVSRLGPALETHPLFPNRTNVQFVRVDSPGRATIRIWERGAGETLASGSSASAVAAACVRHRLTGRRVAVHSRGGVLHVEVQADWMIRLTGPAEEVCRGTLSADLLARLGAGRRT